MDEELYFVIRQDVMAAWNARWTTPGVPVFWRSGGPQPRVEPIQQPQFLRIEVAFGRQEAAAFGGGFRQNLRFQRGEVVLRAFSSRMAGDETEGLAIIGRAVNVFRSYRATDAQGGDLSFVGQDSGFDWGPTEDGVWFQRGYRVSFEYRFYG